MGTKLTIIRVLWPIGRNFLCLGGSFIGLANSVVLLNILHIYPYCHGNENQDILE